VNVVVSSDRAEGASSAPAAPWNARGDQHPEALRRAADRRDDAERGQADHQRALAAEQVAEAAEQVAEAAEQVAEAAEQEQQAAERQRVSR